MLNQEISTGQHYSHITTKSTMSPSELAYLSLDI